MYICLYVCMSLCITVCMYAYMYVWIHGYMYICKYVHMLCIYMLYIYIVSMYICICICIYVCMSVCKYAYMYILYVCIYGHMDICLHVNRFLCTSIYVDMDIWILGYMSIFIYVPVYMYIYIYVYMYISSLTVLRKKARKLAQRTHTQQRHFLLSHHCCVQQLQNSIVASVWRNPEIFGSRTLWLVIIAPCK